jgi:uncharacterized membrane protein
MLGLVGKQRSVHNNYLTLPVLVLMVSSHYPMLTGHPQSWLLVALIIIIGAMVRHFVNRQEAGDPIRDIAWTLPVATIALVAAVIMTAPAEPAVPAGTVVTDADALGIADKHCVMCHSPRPTHQGFDAPPKEVTLATVADLRRHGEMVLLQAVRTKTMPLGNETGMTDEERARLGAWLRQKP